MISRVKLFQLFALLGNSKFSARTNKVIICFLFKLSSAVLLVVVITRLCFKKVTTNKFQTDQDSKTLKLQIHKHLNCALQHAWVLTLSKDSMKLQRVACIIACQVCRNISSLRQLMIKELNIAAAGTSTDDYRIFVQKLESLFINVNIDLKTSKKVKFDKSIKNYYNFQ